MKRKILFYSLLALATIFVVRAAYFMICNATYEPQHGDIIFHVSKSYQSTAIKIGTLSRYSHCGIIVVENGKPYVIEAEGGVEKTPMKTWLRRGRMFHHYRVMRLKNNHPVSVPYTLGGMYDRYFRFNNGMYYCSELVWEIYKKNGITLCKPNPLGDYYFLNIPLVQKHIKSRDLTLDQKVVPPSDLRYSRYLRTVSYGYFSPFWL